eukprot:CAMPEP_0181066068 /NCGR_PEP_ID=MMETSP1070-20121207/25105_1 /TAXON_ID=265543 /ORGANISM="Minutocellus polymorphus, Strain NH13" /LENGTH=384 /DNA_ID=CAMNT_0023146561 /DNA_START=343 /DNA_END=1497 /DNA_ORIENTATION=+
MGNQPSSGSVPGGGGSGPPRAGAQMPGGAGGQGGSRQGGYPGGGGGGPAEMGYATASAGYGQHAAQQAAQYGGGQAPYGAGSPQAQQAQQYGHMKADYPGGGDGGEAMSMDTDSAQPQQGSAAGGGGGGGGQPLDLATLSQIHDDDTVPTVFRWEHGGRQVYITGTFNGWSRQIPMHRSGNDFTYVHNLKRGKHAFKFIVDDEWRFAPDQPTVADIEGRINNFTDVTDFKAYTGDRDFERERNAAECGVLPPRGGPAAAKAAAEGGAAAEADMPPPGTVGPDGEPLLPGEPNVPKDDPDGETFTQAVPDLDEYTKEPPPLPPHLRHIILNKPPQLQDTAALPVPQHVALNHLYCTAIKDNMMVLGITQRYKTKFVTTVYYSPCS